MTSIDDALAQAMQLYQTGDLPRAEAFYREILTVDPRQAEAWTQLGLVFFQQGQVEGAVTALQRAAQLAPHLARIYMNLGLVYTTQGNAAEAIRHSQHATELEPGLADAWFNLGNAYQLQGSLDQAIASYQQSLRLQPDSARTHTNLGWSMQARNDLPAAISHYRQAISLQPNLAEAYFNLATALAGNDQFDEAVAQYQKAGELKPDFMLTFNNLGHARQQQGFVIEAIEAFAQAVRISPELPVPRSNWLFALNYDPDLSTATVLAEHRGFSEMFEPRDTPPPTFANSPDPDRRLKVGYVSPDFFNHPAAYFIEPMIRHHHPAAVESFLYAEVARPDEVTERLRAAAGYWRSTCGLSAEQIADQIRDDGIDILVDLAGHSAHHRLLAFTRRPAPLQITYLGYPNTTGLKSIAYRLADCVTDPPGEPSQYSEQLLYLAGPYSCFAPPRHAPEVGELPAKRNGYITFGSLHKLPKLSAGVLDLWQRLLEAIPAARLLVYHHTLRGVACDRLNHELVRRGISPDRFELRHEKPIDGYLGVYREIDIALDTFPWSGHATTCESLWMGVPMLSLRGDRHAARLSASVLTAAGFAEWIAATPAEFVEKAVQISGQIEHLAELRSRLRASVAQSPLCDGPTFTRQLEETYRSLWHNWCSQR
jgi:predicted O-linked N-acetylglucosamine transferase (SPINDLY family)